MRIKPRFVVGAALIVVAIAYLITTAIRSTSEYYLTVNEAASRRTELGEQPVRVAGRVKPGSIDWNPQTLTLAFTIFAIPDPSSESIQPVVNSEAASFRVKSIGEPKPDMFAEGRDVIVEGRILPTGEIAATQVLTSCPSKYQPKQAR